MLTAILTSLNERRREMAILRSVGARPWHIAGLLVVEAFSLALAGALFGLLLLLYLSPSRSRRGRCKGQLRSLPAAGAAKRL
jgi:ABC-type lipoprotein release transport system permease subunit